MAALFFFLFFFHIALSLHLISASTDSARPPPVASFRGGHHLSSSSSSDDERRARLNDFGATKRAWLARVPSFVRVIHIVTRQLILYKSYPHNKVHYLSSGRRWRRWNGVCVSRAERERAVPAILSSLSHHTDCIRKTAITADITHIITIILKCVAIIYIVNNTFSIVEIIIIIVVDSHKSSNNIARR